MSFSRFKYIRGTGHFLPGIYTGWVIFTFLGYKRGGTFSRFVCLCVYVCERVSVFIPSCSSTPTGRPITTRLSIPTTPPPKTEIHNKESSQQRIFGSSPPFILSLSKPNHQPWQRRTNDQPLVRPNGNLHFRPCDLFTCTDIIFVLFSSRTDIIFYPHRHFFSPAPI